MTRSIEKRRALRLGRRGEWIALLMLLVKGYRPRHRNWRCPGGELDLVVARSGRVVFVEVKTRTVGGMTGATEAVDAKKRQRLIRAAGAYLGRFRLWDRPCRFDLVAIDRGRGVFGWRVRHIQDAFHPDLGRRM